MSILGMGVHRSDESLVRQSPTKSKTPGNKFRLTEGERKLPRPVVFWSDNEKDAFRRNKVVQTRYYMLLDDINNQKRSSQRTIRYEAHKFRQRSARYLQAKHISDSSSYIGSEIMSQSSRNQKSHNTLDDSGSIISSESSERETNFWDKNPPTGVLTKSKKPTVKFSVFKEFIPYEESHLKLDTMCKSKVTDKDKTYRSLSASQQRQIPDLPIFPMERSKSVLPEVQRTNKTPSEHSPQLHSVPNKSTDRKQIRSVFSSTNVYSTSQKSSIDGTKLRTPNKLFFDKSQAAYQLRKELQRLARIRKQSISSCPFTVEQALMEEKEKYIASRVKVTEYLQRMDKEKPADWTGSKWSSPEIEQDV